MLVDQSSNLVHNLFGVPGVARKRLLLLDLALNLNLNGLPLSCLR